MSSEITTGFAFAASPAAQSVAFVPVEGRVTPVRVLRHDGFGVRLIRVARRNVDHGRSFARTYFVM